jgi:hypothetical protein
MVGSVLILLSLLFNVEVAAAQTYTQMQWGMNKATTPYQFGANVNGTWSNLGTVSSAGVWAIPTANISGLGTAAAQNIGTSGATVPLLSTSNTWSLAQTFSSGITGLGTVVAGVWNVPSSNITFTQTGANAVSVTLDSINKQTFDAVSWGVSTANADNATAINRAIQDISASGGGILKLPAGVIATTSVILRNNVYVHGQGIEATTIRLNNGANSTLMATLDAYALFGTGSLSGVSFFGLTDLTLDGNRNNNTNGDCLAMYGYFFTFENVYIKNCTNAGIRSEYGPFGAMASSGYVSNVVIDTTGTHGWQFEGPNDITVNGVIIVDTSLTTNNASYGLYIGNTGNGRFEALHIWQRGGAVNRPAYAMYVATGASNFTISHFEGSYGPAVYLAGSGKNSFDSSNWYYSTFGPNTAIVTVASNNNIVKGTIQGSATVPGNPPRKGIVLAGAGNEIDVQVSSSDLGSIDFTGSLGLNVVRVIGSQSTGPGYIGSPSSNDEVDVDVYGATSLDHLHAKPFAYSFGSSVSLSNTLKLASYVVSGLPSCVAGIAGSMVFVTDSNVTSGNITAGGGANKVIGFCDGSNWTAR